MANEVRLQKTVFEKGNFDKVVDRSFNTFAQPIAVEDLPTVEEFFDLYEQLYYEIPIEGTTQSHQYLIQRSSELVDFQKDTEDIQPLLDEIAILREQILEYQQQLIEANTPE
jgi:hypothetical protein